MARGGSQANKPETYLTPQEREQQSRLFGAVEEFPQKFIAWLDDHLRVNVPQFPITQIHGFQNFQTQIEQFTNFLEDQDWTFIDAKGDLIVGISNDHFTIVPVGSNGKVLTADSTAPGGVKWAVSAASAGTGANIGKRELQVAFGLDTTAVSAGAAISIGISALLADVGNVSDARAFVVTDGSSSTVVDVGGLGTLTITSGNNWDNGAGASGSVSLEDILTVSVSSAGTGAKGLRVILTLG